MKKSRKTLVTNILLVIVLIGLIVIIVALSKNKLTSSNNNKKNNEQLEESEVITPIDDYDKEDIDDDDTDISDVESNEKGQNTSSTSNSSNTSTNKIDVKVDANTKLSVAPNTGSYIINVNEEKAFFRIDFNITSNVTIVSKQYGWSPNRDTNPTVWSNLTGAGIKFSAKGGSHYLWLKVEDNLGNKTTAIVGSYLINYNVSYNLNGGIGTTNDQTKIYNNNLTITNKIPTRSGYKFICWNTKANGNGSCYNNGNSYRENASLLLYAKWEKLSNSEYTVVFNANGGVTSLSNKTVLKDSTYGTLPTPTRSGYTFLGWYTAINGGTIVTSTTRILLNENHVLYARWSAVNQTVTVSFNANGGSVSLSSKAVTKNNSYGTLPIPTKTGYKFLGWYTSASGGSEITASTIVTISTNHSLYARWSLINKTYTISFNCNDGNVCPKLVKLLVTGDVYGDLPIPQKDNYTFVGWYTSLTDGTKVVSTSIFNKSANQVLYARWEANKPQYYTISFNANGGTALVTSKQVLKDGTYGTLSTPTRSGYTFVGWYTSLTNGTKITSSTKIISNSNHTLYAVWNRTYQTYTVKSLVTLSQNNPLIVCSEHSQNCKDYLKDGNITMAKKYPHMEIYNISANFDSSSDLALTISYAIYSGEYGTYNQGVKTSIYAVNGNFNNVSSKISNNSIILRDGQKWGQDKSGSGTNLLVTGNINTFYIPKANIYNNQTMAIEIYTSNSSGYIERFSFTTPALIVCNIS